MNQHFVNKINSDELVIFFAGWGIKKSLVSSMLGKSNARFCVVHEHSSKAMSNSAVVCESVFINK